MKKSEVQEPIEMPIEMIPIDSDTLANVDYLRAQVSKTISGVRDTVKLLASEALKLDMHDARKIEACVDVHNIHHSATEIAQYVGITEMLLSNFANDLNAIHRKRKDFQQQYRLHLACIEAAQKEQAKREADAERIKEKRKADTSGIVRSKT